MEIFSYALLDEHKLNQEYLYHNDVGDEISFSVNYDRRLVVNMDFRSRGVKSTNAQGWARDQNAYFSQLLENHPEAFSERNRILVSEKRAPYCDKRFTDYFPVYKGYEGNKLIHHHIGRDGQAIALPQDLHVGTAGVHIAEAEIGIDSLSKEFSNKVQTDYDNGKHFSWNNANDYYSQIKSDMKRLEIKSQQGDINNSQRGAAYQKIKQKPDSIEIGSDLSARNVSTLSLKEVPSQGINNLKPKGNPFFINTISKKLAKNIGYILVGGIAIGGSSYLLRNPDKAKSFVVGITRALKKPNRVVKTIGSTVSFAQKPIVKETLTIARASPKLHLVKQYTRSSGKVVKEYARGVIK